MINLQKCFVTFLSAIGAAFIFDTIFEKIRPHISWGSDLCEACGVYKCTKYNFLCDVFAGDVIEEYLNNKDEENNGAEC